MENQSASAFPLHGHMPACHLRLCAESIAKTNVSSEGERGQSHGAFYLNAKKIKGQNGVLNAAKHNLREIAAELGATAPEQVAKMHLNYVAYGPGTAAGVAQLAKSMMLSAGLPKLRKDGVCAVEVVLSIPTGFLTDHRPFFDDVIEWVRRYFGVPILSAVIHLDEEHPHCHILLLPLISGRMKGSALVGARWKIAARHDDFLAHLGFRYGLKSVLRPLLSLQKKTELAAMLMQALRNRPEFMNIPDVEEKLFRCIRLRPEALAEAMGLWLPDANAVMGYRDQGGAESAEAQRLTLRAA